MWQSGLVYVTSLYSSLEMRYKTGMLLLDIQIADSAVVAFKKEGIYLDASIILPVFLDYFPYDLLFNWVGNIDIIFLKRLTCTCDPLILLLAQEKDYRIIYINAYQDYTINIICEVSYMFVLFTHCMFWSLSFCIMYSVKLQSI